MHSDLCDALCVQMHWRYHICPTSQLHVLTNKLIANRLNMNAANSMLQVCSGEIPTCLNGAASLAHLNQMTVSTVSNLSFLCMNPFSILLLGEWIQYTELSASVPSVFFFMLSFVENNWGILLSFNPKRETWFWITLSCDILTFWSCHGFLQLRCWMGTGLG